LAASRKIIGSKIKKLRLKLNLTQQVLADKLGVDRQYINKIESGKINMSLDYLDRIVKKLRSKPDDLWNTLKK